MVFASASAFMCATISTSPDQVSVTTQVTSPLASNLGARRRPSSTWSGLPCGAKLKGFSDTKFSPDAPIVGARLKLRSAESEPALACAPAHQREEARLLARVVAEQTAELRRHGQCTGLLDAAQRHAGMLRFHHDRDTARLQYLLDRTRDLRGQVLLRLQAPRVHVDQPRQLGEPDHPFDRSIGDVRLAVERHHVVLAMRME